MPAGRPPKDPALIAKALKLVDDGMTVQEAAEAMKGRVSYRTIYRAQEARRKAAPVAKPSKRSKAAASSDPPETPPPLVVVPPIPPGLSGTAVDLWIFDERINATRTQLHQIQARITNGGSPHGLASLETILGSLMKQRAAIRPPAPADPHEEERRWQGQRDSVIAKIRAGIRDAKT